MSEIARPSLWLPPLLLMALIFFLSAQPDLSSGLGVIDLIGRKLVHAGLYALLAALWWHALRTVVRPPAALTIAIAIAVGYAITDELHQTFVPTRSGTAVDVAIDALGAGLAALYLRRRALRDAAEHGPARGARRAGRARLTRPDLDVPEQDG